jgi:hypothetical protein
MPMLDPTATLILDWLRQIGLSVRLARVDADSFLPGVTLEPGGANERIHWRERKFRIPECDGCENI